MRALVLGAGVGGLACAIDLARAGHRVTVLEQADRPGGKCMELTAGGLRFDCGPSLLTMPQVFSAIFADSGAPLEEELELLRVEPVTRYEFADGSAVELSADLPRAVAALEELSPGAGEDWLSFLATCGTMWGASASFLGGTAPWPPRRPAPGEPAPDPRDALRVRPWATLRQLAAGISREPRLRMIIERFATYAGADPRSCPAALCLAGYVEHAYGAWYPRGGMYGLVRALTRRLEALGGELRLATPARRITLSGGRATGVVTDAGHEAADVVVCAIDEAAVHTALLADETPRGASAARRAPRRRSLSGLVVLLGLEGRTPGAPHHLIRFPADYDAEFDDIFRHGRQVRDPTIYVSSPAATDPGAFPADREGRLVLVNAPAVLGGFDWHGYAERIVARLGVRERVRELVVRSPADLARATGAPDGAIYGTAPRGRLGSLRRPGNRIGGIDGLWLAGGTVHPGGGLPLVALGGRAVARAVGPA